MGPLCCILSNSSICFSLPLSVLLKSFPQPFHFHHSFHLFSLSLFHTPLSVPSNLSLPLPLPLPLTGQDYIFQSHALHDLGNRWSHIPLSSPASPPLSLSPCCLMFQFGGSKHSIRQINCLMHVISQTVYERGPLGPALPLPQQPLRPSHSSALSAHTVYSHIEQPIQAQARRRGGTHAPKQI